MYFECRGRLSSLWWRIGATAQAYCPEQTLLPYRSQTSLRLQNLADLARKLRVVGLYRLCGRRKHYRVLSLDGQAHEIHGHSRFGMQCDTALCAADPAGVYAGGTLSGPPRELDPPFNAASCSRPGFFSAIRRHEG